MRIVSLFLALSLALPAWAEPPKVVTDIAPVHGIVSRVMQGVAAPALLFAADISPHHAAMRPSQARVLAGAEVIFWMGPDLSPQLEQIMATLASEARNIVLPEVAGTFVLSRREGALFADHAGEQDHGGHNHGDGDHDPHGWLDPRNAAIWAQHAAAVLSEADPANAASYGANAQDFAAELHGQEAAIVSQLAPVRGKPFIVLHDATHYFEHRFEVEALAAIAPSDASDPGPARISTLRAAVAKYGPLCAFSEPQSTGRLIATVADGTPMRHAVLDPLGQGIALGPIFYQTLLQRMADAMLTCLNE